MKIRAASPVTVCLTSSRAGSSQANSSWLINDETTTIVTGPSPATGYAIVTPSSAQA